MENLNLTIVCTTIAVEFDKKTGEKELTYKAVIMRNIENVSFYVGVEFIKATLHQEFVEKCKKAALKIMDVKESDFEAVNVNDILI